MPTKAYAAPSPGAPLAPFQIERREPGDRDVEIEIAWCGVCHSDVHQVRDEWREGIFPMVPGHEIVGRVSRVGSQVERFRPGDRAGVGCFVDSCRACEPCRRGLEQFCERGAAVTYNGTEMDRRTLTYGGYSGRIVADERYVLRIADDADLAATAPLLCAGITTYSPLRHWGAREGTRVAVAGLGGLGHVAVKLAASMGAEVTVLTSSPGKEADARRLGAHDVVVAREDAAFRKLRSRFDLVLDTVSAPHDLNRLLRTVRIDGTLVLVGIPPAAAPVHAFSLVAGRRSLAGSYIGGIAETQEMLDWCASHRIGADVEPI
ncbi:MAG TPA: NAD(P)-dependent alcohol dehydrogenase, partial [Anaeromyxobacter sp.]